MRRARRQPAVTGGQRGAALPETALVLTLMLTLIVGALRIALVGYEQVAADGAAFYHAHQSGIQGTYPDAAQNLDPDDATHKAFGQSQAATISSGTYMPPTASIGTEYGFDQAGNRHGGASLMQPLQTISTVSHSAPSLLMFGDAGSVLTVTGVGVEPTFRETGGHGNIDGFDFGTGSSFTDANDYFSQGENTPPYFGGFHFMRFCSVPDDTTTSWTGCPVKVSYLALGLAEYLDQENWGRMPNGIAPLKTAVFWETLYHQNVYAQLTSDPVNAIPSDISTPAGKMAAQKALDRTKNPALCSVYSWDSAQQGGLPSANYTPGKFPLNPGASC
ncbi:MAG TPA: TadE family protein [Candidatus Elarobacter sp.]|nr:TadE family protein [Candidatus Elarobacter sp.]